MAIRSILVIPFADGIGDFINMQPLLPVIRARFPDAEITVAVSEHGNLLCNDPAIRTLKPASFNHEPGKTTVSLRWLLPQTVLAWFAGPLFDYELGPFDLVINCFFAWERAMDFRGTWTPQVPPVPDAVHSLDCLADELERELQVAIPPGVEDGTRIRLAGEGEAGGQGAPPGDLYVHVSIRPHPMTPPTGSRT